MTASVPSYVVVMNGSLSEANRNLSGLDVGLDDMVPVTNGTACDVGVRLSLLP